MSILHPKGFVAAGGAMGIKPTGVADVAIVATSSGRPCSAAATFTQNRAAAAPVQVSRRHLAATGGQAGAVVLTSGNANAATGAAGVAVAETLCQVVATEIGLEPEEVLVCQTGLIGIPFPAAATLARLPAVIAARDDQPTSALAAATAILTTDTKVKEVAIDGPGFKVGAMAKGAAMLAPNMATMLAVLTTDAAIEPEPLQALLRRAVAASFNRLHVDGATSTNDTVIVLASGAAGPVDHDALGAALLEACASLAAQMADDAEGATKVCHLVVRGAASDAEAHRAARQVADSLLVKCSLNGEDPYWGRIVSELGCAEVAFDLDRVSVAYGGVVVCAGGVGIAHDAAAVAAHLAERHVTIECDLGLGEGSATMLCNDLSYGYLDENRTTS